MREKVEVRVAISGFWPGATFDKIAARLSFMSRKFTLIEDQARPQIVMFGPYVGRQWSRTMPTPPDRGVPTTFMTGENVEPDMSRCDFATTFSRAVDDPRHFRMPNWVHRLYMLGSSPYALLAARRRVIVPRRRFCAYLARNAVPFREQFVTALSRHQQVDSPSRSMSNMAPIGDTPADKINFLKHYRFNIAFENAAWSGYTTEKLPDALLAGCVPLYWGDPNVALDFNPLAFLNLADFESPDALAEEVKRMELDPRLRWAMQEQPAFVDDRLPDCANEELLFAFWERVFDTALAN